MDRREAVLRELNLYPLWVRRGVPAPGKADAGAGAGTGAGVAASAATHSSVEPVSPVGSPLAAGNTSPGDSFTQERPAAVSQVAEDKVHDSPGTADWPQLKTMVRDCTACGLRSGCTQTVFGTGDPQAEWLFVGEGPGAEEDAQGEPFVGEAGKLLDNMLLSIKLRRGKNVFIANTVKCRPPNNRAPEANEIAACLPYLKRQIELIKPKLIVALGKTASNALLGTNAPLGSLRGKLHDFNGISLVVTYHPAYLLRSPLEKAKAWHDLCLATDSMQKP